MASPASKFRSRLRSRLDFGNNFIAAPTGNEQHLFTSRIHGKIHSTSTSESSTDSSASPEFASPIQKQQRHEKILLSARWAGNCSNSQWTTVARMHRGLVRTQSVQPKMDELTVASDTVMRISERLHYLRGY